jgi:hypothetical protein
MYINVTPQTPGVYLGLFAAKRFMFSESCSEVSVLLRRGVGPGTYNSMKIRFRPSAYGPRGSSDIQWREYPLINHVKYLAVIFDKWVTWRLHLEMAEAKAFRTFIRIYSPLKIERLSVKIKTPLYKALIRSVITHACPAWELSADPYILQLQRLQNKALCAMGHLQGADQSTFSIYTII